MKAYKATGKLSTLYGYIYNYGTKEINFNYFTIYLTNLTLTIKYSHNAIIYLSILLLLYICKIKHVFIIFNLIYVILQLQSSYG